MDRVHMMKRPHEWTSPQIRVEELRPAAQHFHKSPADVSKQLEQRDDPSHILPPVQFQP